MRNTGSSGDTASVEEGEKGEAMTDEQEERLRGLTIDERLTPDERSKVFRILAGFAAEPDTEHTRRDARDEIMQWERLAAERGRAIVCDREPGQEG